jgi:hypothetical protein
MAELNSTSDGLSDELIADLEAEWHALAEAQSIDVEAWEQPITNMTRDYGTIRAAGRWQRGPSDFFGVLRISRGELAHCSMIAWLLDPEGRHGLGRALLDCLADRHLSPIDRVGMRVRSVETEVQRYETRADIVVWGVTFTLIVEAKVDAGESWRQCDRLYDRFSTEPGSQFVFLTPSGRPPVTATGPAGNAFVPLSFQHVADCLEAALETRDPAIGRGTEIARNYLDTLRKEFS